MAPPSQETITILALDKQQQPVFRVQFISIFYLREGYTYEEKESLCEGLAPWGEGLPFCSPDGAGNLPAVRSFSWLYCLGPCRESSTWTRTGIHPSEPTAS